VARRFITWETRLSFFLCLIAIVVRSAVFTSNLAGQSTLENDSVSLGREPQARPIHHEFP
jgi:hypothetical protein